MTDEQLAKLIADDDFGLLVVKPRRTPQTTEEERLVESFGEVVRFVEETGAAPSRLGLGIEERRLFARLEAIRNNVAQRQRLLPFDEHGILSQVADSSTSKPKEGMNETAPSTIEDVLNDSFLDGLESGADELFRLKHVPTKVESASPDYVAQRKPCKDFHLFEERLSQCQRDLKAEKRRLLPFANEQQIEAGKFFVLRGVLVLVAEVGSWTETKGRWNARLRCIFENGTESDMLLRSLSSQLYQDGRMVTELFEDLLKPMMVNDEDKASGFIYVLRSLSPHPDVRAIPNLYKIGLARASIEERIRNAPNEPTYLMAPVELVATFQCFNVNLLRMENLLHRFFGGALVKVQVTDGQGNYRTPKEWFSVPLPAIEAAVRLLISGQIVDYEYDLVTGEVVLRKKQP